MTNDWMARGACSDGGPYDALFFADRGDTDTRAAKNICKACPVRAACLNTALTMPDNPEGIWGGTSVLERRILRRAKAAA